MDLKIIREKRPPIDKNGLQRRVRQMLKTRRAKIAAQNIYKSLRKACVQVKASGGLAYNSRRKSTR